MFRAVHLYFNVALLCRIFSNRYVAVWFKRHKTGSWQHYTHIAYIFKHRSWKHGVTSQYYCFQQSEGLLFNSTFSTHKLPGKFCCRVCSNDKQWVKVEYIPTCKFALYSHQNYLAAGALPETPTPLHGMWKGCFVVRRGKMFQVAYYCSNHKFNQFGPVFCLPVCRLMPPMSHAVYSKVCLLN